MVKTGKKQRKNKLPGWPRRPLSAYNIYFKVQRSLIINNKSGMQNTHTFDAILKNSHRRDCVEHDGESKKRLHRISHGKIGFADLARTISKRWNACDAQTRAYFESHALVEKRGYEKELKVYRNNLREKTSSKEEGTKESDTETVEIVNEPDVAKSKANKGCTNPALTNLIHSTHSLSCSENLEPLPFNQFASTDLIELDQETCDYVVTVFGTARKS